ncbi:MAG: response regulator transcription factor [Clostridia bacterium]|nr:response regulator transcription factor [Clostridia bacterium]
MYNALIVDDHESMCDSLSYTLENTGEFTVLDKLSRADHAEAFCEKIRPDIILMDVCTGGEATGIDATKIIRKRFPDVKVIVMSGFDEITYAPRAREAGAHAFIFKSKSLAYFAQAAKGVMEGQTYYPETKTIPVPSGEAPLTERDMEVLRLMCRHMTSQDIANELFVSIGTVKYHKSKMLAKTGFEKSIDLVFYMVSKGWIKPEY